MGDADDPERPGTNELIDTLWNVNLCRTKAQDLHAIRN